MTEQQRTIVIITEGAAPALLDRWCAQGLLPGFARLRSEGASGPLAAEGTPYEPPGLVSVLTGQRAADHGYFSYWTCHDPEYSPQVLGSGDRRHPLLWQHEGFAGLRFASIGLFGTHPIEPMDGSLISYPMQATLHACHPRDLQRRLAKEGIRPVHDVSIFWTGQPREQLLPRLLEADRQRGRAALALLPEHDVVIVNLTSIDRTSHIYWQELEHGPDREQESAVFAAYRTCDQVVQDALAAAGDRADVLAFSEIGFGPLRTYCSVNDDLERAGLLARTPDGRIDWANTTAFEAVQGTHGINVNVRDRYKAGRIAEHEYERVRAEVRTALLETVNPRTGREFLAEVLTREEVYPGAATAGAPDLLMEPADWRYLPMGDPQWAAHVHRTWQSGWHRRESYWAGLGPGFASRYTDDTVAAPIDVPATLARLHGRPVPEGWRGRPLGPAVP
ncbi:alkaline phosphatase family protein [Streptomyces sp. BE303]|uniref:alkaline phosphatase family protein n=1 Tax=Streptomyces sp. BE303 TaxID=3002528 RepID=UPI002E7894D2|nr:alkaline phosphatase family protein [Streptomyces sp. BE303]MED7953426.1 alkaline phosphatase family protein [Streptomyces sp. BE303]